MGVDAVAKNPTVNAQTTPTPKITKEGAAAAAPSL
jgi:hypothetical protein